MEYFQHHSKLVINAVEGAILDSKEIRETIQSKIADHRRDRYAYTRLKYKYKTRNHSQECQTIPVQFYGYKSLRMENRFQP